MERHWPDPSLFVRSCACNSSNVSDLPLVYTSASKELELHFIATNMTAKDDPDAINFEATYEFIKGPYTCKENRKKSGPSGSGSLTQEEVRTFGHINAGIFHFHLKFYSG